MSGFFHLSPPSNSVANAKHTFPKGATARSHYIKHLYIHYLVRQIFIYIFLTWNYYAFRF